MVLLDGMMLDDLNDIWKLICLLREFTWMDVMKGMIIVVLV